MTTTTISHPTLSERIEHVKKLDATRMPGQLVAAFGEDESIVCLRHSPPFEVIAKCNHLNHPADARFLAQAPAMMEIITELTQRLEVARQGVWPPRGECYNAADLAKPFSPSESA